MCLGLAETASFSTEAARAIRAGGWRLHSGWRNLRGVDSALRAGTMWMVAQRTMATSAEDLDDVWATYHTLKAFLNERSRAGTPPKARAETFFHAMAAETALLRGEMSIAREEAREAMVFGEPGDVSSLLGAATAALAQAMSGDVEGYAASAKWFERHAIGCGSFADIAAPVFHLARGLTAIRRLDREAAEEAMHLASVLTQGGEFWSVYAWIRALQDLVWSDGMHGLARLEATAARNAPAVGPPSITGVYEIQARTELLCGAGRINQDNALIKEESRHNRYHLVTEARIHLCGRDGASAVRVAERGLYDAAAELPDLAHLSTIRAAGLLSMDAEPEVVLDALEEACTFCTELENLLPFVYMPADLRAGLLTLHDTRGHHGECILSMPESRARLAEVRNNHEYSSALVRLTAREELLLPILATSATAEEIARNLQVSVNTVRKQVVTLRQKLDAHTRKAMIENAYRLGLLDTRPSEEPTNRPRPAL
jgi:DNA-binding NarL/FixJ family response regulator